MNRRWRTDGNEKIQLHLHELQLIALSIGIKQRNFILMKYVQYQYLYLHCKTSLRYTIYLHPFNSFSPPSTTLEILHWEHA